MARQIPVQCSAELAGLLADALCWFVATRYPHGADECSIAAREALLDLAERFRGELAVNGRCAYSSRVRAFLTEAVSSYTRHLECEEGRSWAQRRAALIAVSRGQSAGEDYARAAAGDRQAPAPGGAA